jgi:ribosomal-protein-alanine N-acetyltransferase
VLTDGVVQWRPFDERDAAALAKIWRDAEIRARNDVPEASEEAARAWVARSAARAAADEAWEWAIVDAQTNELAGRQALKGIDWADGRAAAAIWVAPRCPRTSRTPRRSRRSVWILRASRKT